MADVKIKTSSVVNLVDESFNGTKPNTCHLSILVNFHPGKAGASENSFSFCVLDTNTNKYLVLKESEDISDFSGLWEGSSAVPVTCAVAHNKFTLVPSALFDEESKKSLIGFNHEVKDNEEIFVNTISHLDAKNIFTIPEYLVSAMRKIFSNIHFIHNSTSFTEGLLAQNKNNSAKKIFADFHSSYFEIVVLQNGKLLLSNAFKYKTAEDIAYYILFVYEQLHLNPEEVTLVLSGEIEKTAKEHSLLYTYIRNVKFASLPCEFNYSYKFDDIPSHKFFSLFTQYLSIR